MAFAGASWAPRTWPDALPFPRQRCEQRIPSRHCAGEKSHTEVKRWNGAKAQALGAQQAVPLPSRRSDLGLEQLGMFLPQVAANVKGRI